MVHVLRSYVVGLLEPFAATFAEELARQADTEIAALISQAASLSTPLRRATIATFIGLLAVTGMRRGEVIDLDDTDFEPAVGLLVVRCGKAGKSRQTPLHPTTITALNTYRELRGTTFPVPVSASLLVSSAGTRLSRRAGRTSRVDWSGGAWGRRFAWVIAPACAVAGLCESRWGTRLGKGGVVGRWGWRLWCVGRGWGVGEVWGDGPAWAGASGWGEG